MNHMYHSIIFFVSHVLFCSLVFAAEPFQIASQGFFSAGGTVTEPVPGKYDPTKNWLDQTRAGNTAHIDHANVLFQQPVKADAAPVVFLHGYGQSRLGWMGTPDGRPGWSDFFLRKGHPVFLVDQPRRGEAGATAKMSSDGFLDAWGADSKGYKPGDQAWYTHFRIGRVLPERYVGSQFPEGEAALNQFLRQGTPNTGDYDETLFGKTLGDVLAEVRARTGRKSVYVTHSQGGRVGWATPVENIAAIVAVEPGGTPAKGSAQYKALLLAKVPIILYFGDYIDNGPEDIQSTAFWRSVRDQARAFASAYRADGGDATVVDLPAAGFHGNSHFLFQEKNSDSIAEHIENWLRDRNLTASMIDRSKNKETQTMGGTVLTSIDNARARLGAAVARGDQTALAAALEDGFAAGMTVNEAKELIGQLYAYCGFPRALNAAATLMKTVQKHAAGGDPVAVGAAPGPMSKGASKDFGTANQTKLCGGPVKGPLFDFHPQLDEYLKAHLFGDIFARDNVSWRTRELVTVAALAARPETAPQCASHVRVAQLNGVSPAETDAILALVRFSTPATMPPPDWSAFPIGEPNVAFANYFIGNSFLAPLSREQVGMAIVTFAPGCRNNWHIHHASKGGGQILTCTAGRGYVQFWGEPAREMKPGDTVNIPAGVKHWHGAAPDSWFQHIAVEVPCEGRRNEWLEPVDDKSYHDAAK